MIKNIYVETEELVEIFILSSTPYYLFKNFFAHPYIKKISEQNSTPELIDLFEKEKDKEKKTYEEIVLFYSIIIALTIKPYDEVKNFFLQLGDASFRWAKQISEIYFTKRKSESIVTSDLRYRSELLKTDFGSNTNTNISEFERYYIKRI